MASLISWILISPHLFSGGWVATPSSSEGNNNTALAEALAWRQGRLTLAGDFYEDAEFDGKHYNAVGLAYAIMSVPGTWIGERFGVTDAIPGPLLAVVMVGPLMISTFFAIRSGTKTHWWAAVLTIAFLAGSPAGPCVFKSHFGDIYGSNHVLAVSGIFIIAADLLGRRRIWPALLGLCLASWSRQMTSLYALPILIVAIADWRSQRQSHKWQRKPISGEEIPPSDQGIVTNESTALRHGASRSGSFRRVVVALVGITFIALVPMSLNMAKFGSPFESGYRYMYESQRTDPIATRARKGMFRIENVPMHFHAMNLEHPAWDIRHGRLHLDLVDVIGGSIWLTTPLTIGVILTARRWWRDPVRRILMLGTVPVMAGLSMYHATGAEAGFYRYALDFLPIWWLVIAPYTESTSTARRWSLEAIAYSLLYYWVLHWN